MVIIKGQNREFWQCDVEIKSRKVDPKESIRGEIARTYLYIDSVYPDREIISNKNSKLFHPWHKSDPVDEWKCERAKIIEIIQGNRNEVVLRDC
jgi:deoxyribonuclease-1